jgi:DNA-binding MarR family transcriptional regulator
MEIENRVAELPPALQLTRLLWRLNHSLSVASIRTARQTGLTERQEQILALIQQRPGIAAVDISEFLHIHPTTVAGVVRRLRRAKLIASAPNPEDSRRNVLRLTERGLGAMSHPGLAAALERAIASLPERARAEAEAVFAVITRELDEHSGGAMA